MVQGKFELKHAAAIGDLLKEIDVLANEQFTKRFEVTVGFSENFECFSFLRRNLKSSMAFGSTALDFIQDYVLLIKCGLTE